MYTLALPNGNLRQMTESIFAEAGIKLPQENLRQHLVVVDHPIVSHVIWLKPSDIPWAVYEGHLANIGITGSDCYNEWRCSHNRNGSVMPDLRCVGELVYSKSVLEKTRIALIDDRPEKEPRCGPSRGERVVTEFPNWTPMLLPVNSSVVAVHGSVEAYVGNLFRYGVTRVETGRSLRENGLRIVKILHYSSPRIYVTPGFRELDRVLELACVLEQSLSRLSTLAC